MESTAAVAESTAAVAVSTTHRRRWAAAEKELCAQGVERFGAFNHKRIAALVGTRLDQRLHERTREVPVHLGRVLLQRRSVAEV